MDICSQYLRFIWHTIGSGKTLTSFKASTLLKNFSQIVSKKIPIQKAWYSGFDQMIMPIKLLSTPFKNLALRLMKQIKIDAKSAWKRFVETDIDYDYIMQLVLKYTNATAVKQKMTRDKLIWLVDADAKSILFYTLLTKI